MIAVFAAIGILIIAGTLFLFVPKKLPLSDSELIDRTKDFKEVQAFLAKYPNATSAVVMRSSDIGVDHEISNFELQGKPLNYSDPQFALLRMEVYMNENDLRLLQVSLVCRHGSFYTSKPLTFQIITSGTPEEPEILEYLDKGMEERCFDPVVQVQIDVKDGSEPDDPNAKALIPVMILTTDNFDASHVNVSSVKFGGSGASVDKSLLEDVDEDGDLDLILEFNIALGCGTTSVALIGETLSGTHIVGSDAVKTMSCEELIEQMKKNT